MPKYLNNTWSNISSKIQNVWRVGEVGGYPLTDEEPVPLVYMHSEATVTCSEYSTPLAP